MQRKSFDERGQRPRLDGSIGIDDDIVLGIIDVEVEWLFVRRRAADLGEQGVSEFILAEHFRQFLHVD